jgi:urea transport system permease protein
MSTPCIPSPKNRAVLSRAGWTAFVVALIVVCAVAPLLNLVVPKDSVFHMSDYAVALVGKIMCYAICALAMDLIWGYTGILSLGHGLFFALGGYAMGMYLMRQIGRDGNYKSDLPDFMVFLDWKELPWHWTFSDSFIATLFSSSWRCRGWWPLCSATSPSARASRACTSRSSRRP